MMLLLLFFFASHVPFPFIIRPRDRQRRQRARVGCMEWADYGIVDGGVIMMALYVRVTLKEAEVVSKKSDSAPTFASDVDGAV